MTLARGALRCIGYLVACLPVRLGLAAILWDANRQGWHDRIASTLVVMDTGPEPSPPLPRSATPPPPLPAPDLLGPLRRGALPALLYVALAVLMTLPVALHLNTRRAGPRGDGDVFMWNLWLFDDALRHGKPLTSTDLAFYPQTVPLVYHTMDWVACATAVPLLRVLSLTATYNVVVMLTLAAGAFAMYWLAAAVTRCHWSSVVAGFAFGFSSYMMAHALAHLNLISVQFLPVACLLFYSAVLTGRSTHALAAGVALGLCGLCDWYCLVFGAIALVCLAATAALSQGRPSPTLILRVGGLGLVSAATAALLLLPLLARAWHERSRGSYMNVPLCIPAAWGARALDFVRPSELHPLRRPLADGPRIDRQLAPGLVILGLGAVGLWRKRRLLTPWVTLSVCGAVLAAGPLVDVHRVPGMSAGASILLGGPPGTGLDLPLRGQYVSAYCLEVAGNPESALTQFGPMITLPLYWLTRGVPLLGPFKIPARFGLLAILGLSVCAAVGLSSLHDAWVSRRGRRAARMGVAVLCAAIVFESLAVPYPTVSTEAHWFYHRLAQDPGDFAIVEAPVSAYAPLYQVSQYQAYQTVHHKRLLEALLSRTPPEAFALIDGNRLLQYLRAAPGFCPDGRVALATPPERPAPAGTPEDRASWAEAVSQLRRVDARFIVVHKTFLEPESLRLCRALLAGELRLPVAVDDDELTVFALK